MWLNWELPSKFIHLTIETKTVVNCTTPFFPIVDSYDDYNFSFSVHDALSTDGNQTEFSLDEPTKNHWSAYWDHYFSVYMSSISIQTVERKPLFVNLRFFMLQKKLFEVPMGFCLFKQGFFVFKLDIN